MAFIENIIQKAQANPKTVILPEPEDPRTLKAALEIEEKQIANVILVGNQDVIFVKMKEMGISRNFEIVDPSKASWTSDYSQTFYEMRKNKGLTPESAAAIMKEPIPHGMMMLHKGQGDGLVAGAIHSTGDTLRPALQILRTAPGCALVSAFFFMDCGDTTYIFADSGLVEDPDASQLAEIAISSAQTALAFNIPPIVAMISYSTKGSAKSRLTEKVVEATNIAQKRAAEIFSKELNVYIDGELQVDAAIVDEVGSKKAPGSPVAGKARVLIFPDLNCGNSAYKLVQRLAGAEAYGPIIQGIRMPVNDLSRGCTASDIVGVAAITVVQSQMRS